MTIGDCPHNVIFMGLCATCGAIAPKHQLAPPGVVNPSEERSEHTHGGGAFAARDLDIALSKEYVSELEDIKLTELLSRRELILVNDLDHTLLHAVNESPSNLVPSKYYYGGGSWGSHVCTVDDILIQNSGGGQLPIGHQGPCLIEEYLHLEEGLRARIPEMELISTNFEDLLLPKPFPTLDHLSQGKPTTRYPHYAKAQTEEEEAMVEGLMVKWERALHFVLRSDDNNTRGYKRQGSIPQPALNFYRGRFKLRPGVFRYLRDSSKLFELYVYTAGSTSHAEASRHLLDPEHRFFGSNLFSRDHMAIDDANALPTEKRLSYLFPTLHRLAIVLDDSDNVWDLDNAAVLRVIPYHFWTTGNILFNQMDSTYPESTPNKYLLKMRQKHSSLLQPHPSVSSPDQRLPVYDVDFQLGSVLRVLKQLHAAFFDEVEAQASLALMDTIDTMPLDDMPTLRDLLITNILSPIGQRGGIITPIYPRVDTRVVTNRPEHITDYDFWLIASGFDHQGFLYRPLGLRCQRIENNQQIHQGNEKAEVEEKNHIEWIDERGSMNDYCLKLRRRYIKVERMLRDHSCSLNVNSDGDEIENEDCDPIWPDVPKSVLEDLATDENPAVKVIGYSARAADNIITHHHPNADWCSLGLEYIEACLFSYHLVDPRSFCRHYHRDREVSEKSSHSQRHNCGHPRSSIQYLETNPDISPSNLYGEGRYFGRNFYDLFFDIPLWNPQWTATSPDSGLLVGGIAESPNPIPLNRGEGGIGSEAYLLETSHPSSAILNIQDTTINDGLEWTQEGDDLDVASVRLSEAIADIAELGVDDSPFHLDSLLDG